jgi:pimeloyl-ACP methyl ester carboxylesterase
MSCTSPCNSRRRLRQSLALAITQLALAWFVATSSSNAHADEAILGNWHGQVQSPAGPLTVIVTLTHDDNGTLAAGFQVPSQAPGVVIPTTEVVFDGQTLSFRVPRAAATWSGTWRPNERRFEGTFSQGMEMKLDLTPGLPPAAPVIQGLDGKWSGTLDRNGTLLRLVLNVQTTEAGTVATLDSPDMGATGLPVTGLTRDGNSVSLSVPVASVSYSAQLNPEQTELCGDWIRPGQPEATVCLRHAGEYPGSATNSRPPRPQEPADNVPYERREVRFVNPRADDIELAGTLTVPDGPGPFPAALLISGSGPQDRDETFMGHKPFLVLADHLTRSGIAVLRYDDRGFGASGGDHWAATSADFATDARAAVDWLALQPNIRADAIGLIGHSEGGLIAPIAADADDRIAWLVLLAAPGVNMLDLLSRQTEAMALSQGTSPEQLERVLPIQRRIWQIVAEAEDLAQTREQLEDLLTTEVLETLGTEPEQKPAIITSALRPWVRYLLRFDPATFLRRLDVPVLALNGSLDIQVPATANLAAMRAHLADHTDATVIEIPRLNHLFQTASTGAIGEYRDIEETFAPQALAIISEWILLRFGGEAARSEPAAQ